MFVGWDTAACSLAASLTSETAPAKQGDGLISPDIVTGHLFVWPVDSFVRIIVSDICAPTALVSSWFVYDQACRPREDRGVCLDSHRVSYLSNSYQYASVLYQPNDQDDLLKPLDG